MSCPTGMFQRLDRMRKHSFGVMGVFGENNNSHIAGVWFWRGQDLAFEVHARVFKSSYNVLLAVNTSYDNINLNHLTAQA